MNEKEVGTVRVFRITEDGVKMYEVVEEVGSYFSNAERYITRYTRTNPNFQYDKETIIGE